MGALTRDQILQAPDIEVREVEVPEWGGTVRVRSMSAGDLDVLENWIASAEGAGLDDFRARVVALTAIGEDGERLFAAADVAALAAKSMRAVERVFAVAAELSALTRTESDLLGKASGARSGASFTDSRSSSG